MSEEIIAWIVLYLILSFVCPIFVLDSGAKYWQVVAGINVIILICILAIAIFFAGFWALGVVLT